jgi:hypothetical protein
MLKYHNDGKEKSESHEIYESDFSEIEAGYGRTKHQAFLNFKNNVEVRIKTLQNYLDSELKEEKTIGVNCMGEPIKRRL